MASIVVSTSASLKFEVLVLDNVIFPETNKSKVVGEVGDAEGLTVGESDGAFEGFRLGTADGEADGFTDG